MPTPCHAHAHAHATLYRAVLYNVQVGQDKLSAAFTEMMNEDPKSQELLDQAMDKFEVGAGCWALIWR